LAARTHGHVASDQEREPAEHLLFGETGFAGDQFADAIGEVLVIGHAGDGTTTRCTAEPTTTPGSPGAGRHDQVSRSHVPRDWPWRKGIGRARFEPGWRWSNDVKPIAGTEWCMFLHEGC
jgi:hypothetical protein